MKSQIVKMLLALIIVSSCSSNETKEMSIESSNDIIEQPRPTNPKIETDYGQIGEYHTMDEYYLDENGGKVWHGHRKNLYPTLSPKIVSFYEHGELMWTETYDEVGNILSSNR